MINLPTKFEFSTYTHYTDMTADTKCQNWGSFGVVRGHSTSLEIMPFDKVHMSS